MHTLMHITEVSSGGVLPVIAGLCNGMVGKYNIVLVYGVRFDTPDNIEMLFDKRVKLIAVKDFTRKLSINKDFSTMRTIRAIVQEFKPSVVHFHSSKAGYVGRICLLNYKCIKFYSPHGYSFLKADNGAIKKIIYYLAEMLLARTGCITIACGVGEYELARKHGINAICLENGLDTNEIDKLYHDYDTNDFSIYTVGRISPQKNPVMFNELAERLYPVPFIWIGGGDDEYTHALTSPNIRVTGVLKREEVIECSQHFHCYVSCSPSEGLPIALLEAMYLRKICVVTNVSGNNELIDNETGYLFDNVDRCEKIIREIMMNSDEARQKAKKARERVLAKYSMEKMCEVYGKIIVNRL